MLRKTQKVACLRIKYYIFKQRLKYKCLMFNVNYKLVSEYRTSKICGNYRNYNEALGALCVYYCSKCRCMMIS